MSAHFDYWFETKTSPNALGAIQLSEHHKNLSEGAKHERLFIVTPDSERPTALDALGDERVIWFNFRAMSDAIDEMLDDDTTFVGEQTRFLLRELQQLFAEDGLLDIADTVIVAARFAWGEYNSQGKYICQADRSFRPGLTHGGEDPRSAPRVDHVRPRHGGDIALRHPHRQQNRPRHRCVPGGWDDVRGAALPCVRPLPQPRRRIRRSRRSDRQHDKGSLWSDVGVDDGTAIYAPRCDHEGDRSAGRLQLN